MVDVRSPIQHEEIVYTEDDFKRRATTVPVATSSVWQHEFLGRCAYCLDNAHLDGSCAWQHEDCIIHRARLATLQPLPVTDSGAITEAMVEIGGLAIYRRRHSGDPLWQVGLNKHGYHQEPYVSFVPDWQWRGYGEDARAVLTAVLSMETIKHE